MTDIFKSKRVIFPKGYQKKFIIKSKNKLNFTWNQMAKNLNISTRNLIDWKNEKISMSFNALKILCKKTKIKMPKNIKIKEPFWYTKKAGKIGGIKVYKKYEIIGGDPQKRKEMWYKWWLKEGRYKNSIINTLPIKKPAKNKDLAELIGIILGDGGVTKYQLIITLNIKEDKEYANFVAKLIKKLFNVFPKIYPSPKKSVNNIVVSRVELVKFLTSVGIVVGNKVKQKVNIPIWIKKNKLFLISCLRGLIDTDGCIFIHSYKINNKVYYYKKLAFSNKSKPLIKTVYNSFKKLGLNPRITKDGKDVRIENKTDIEKYFKIIGSHNLRHLKKRYK